MSRVPASVALAVVIVSELVFLTGDLRAPWSGANLIAIPVALLGLGFIARLRGVLLAAVATATVVIAWHPPWEDQPISDAAANCDPSCGISTLGLLIIVLPVVAALAAAGALLRIIARRGARSRSAA